MPSAATHSTTSYGPVQPLMSLLGGVRYNSTKSPFAKRFSPDKAVLDPRALLIRDALVAETIDCNASSRMRASTLSSKPALSVIGGRQAGCLPITTW